jgi:outer membrane protein OmpA-like peptidoglycan-associated protein
MMKRLIFISLLTLFTLRVFAQVTPEVKPSTVVFHVFYNDFKTARLIRTTSLNNVFNKNLWGNIGSLQMGFGFNYLKGISKKIDFVSSLDGSATDCLFKNGTYNGSNKFLLDANAGLNIKLLTDRHTIVPYFMAGAGFSLYQGNAGFYIPVGIGFQFNLFNDAFVLTNMQYRRAVSNNVNDHFQYNIGIGVSIGKRKIIRVPIIPQVKISKPDTVAALVKVSVKNIVVTVSDEQTGLPLPGVDIVINGPEGKTNISSDINGMATFNAVKAADYSISGTLHGIGTNVQPVTKSSFNVAGNEIGVKLVHNDPRFTLNGVVTNKSTNKPESGVTITAVNTANNSSTSSANLEDGTFGMQLNAGGDFTISGKKAGYISNIEKVSTKGLNRNTTLYVKLELGMEEARPDKTITLSNIYYDLGSVKIKPAASSDLEKLIRFLKDNPGVKIEIASHTDSRGSAAKNKTLSQARAQQVVNYLQKNGIDKNRLKPKGYGATRLVNGCKPGIKCTEARHEQNRRTEFKVINN